MSIIQQIGPGEFTDLKLIPNNKGKIDNKQSKYDPTSDELKTRQMIITNFTQGNVTMYKPRYEFNDLSVIARMNIDQMGFNTYQSNNGDPTSGDQLTAWKSRAVKPIIRNKVISIAAHSTARLIFPKIFAYDEDSEEQKDAANVMEDLMEWSAEQSDYSYYALNRTLSSLTDPVSIGYTEYAEVFRNVKREKGSDGKWKIEKVIDETLSGFQNICVPADQLYIENFYEPDIQKQGWLIWRRVLSYYTAEAMHSNNPNWKYVTPGVQLIYNDANQNFYEVYDSNLRQDCVEEIRYWNKNLDLYVVMVNGVLLSDFDNPNPRNDKLYPFDKFGYELINQRCFYYKSLAFKIGPESNIVNTLYPMIIDGTYLNLMPPMINIGGEAIGADVIIPGAVTTLSDPNADLKAVTLSTNLKAGMDTLFKVEEAVNQSSEDPLLQGQDTGAGDTTAYQISRMEQNANTVLGLFIKMIGQHVKDFGKLRLGDILQYLTILDVEKITDNEQLVFKTFLLPNKTSGGKKITKKIKFDSGVPSGPQDSKQRLDESYKAFDEQGGGNDVKLYKVNPELFRNLKYMVQVSPDVLNPRSDELERAFKLEVFDRAIQLGPIVDQEALTRDFLFGAYEGTVGDPDKYVKKNVGAGDPMQQAAMQAQGGQGSNALAEIAKSSSATQGLTSNPTPSIKI